jgi:hypothetical protein
MPVVKNPDIDGDDDSQDPNDGVPLARPVAIPRPFGPPPIGPPIIPPAPIAPDGEKPAAPGVVVTPANPFGLPPGSSMRPGVITPAPQQPAQTTPRNAQD